MKRTNKTGCTCVGEIRLSPLDNEVYARERQAYKWARDNQGFAGTWQDWESLDAETRRQYELGAAGIPTDAE